MAGVIILIYAGTPAHKPTEMSLNISLESNACKGNVTFLAELRDGNGKRLADFPIGIYAGKDLLDTLYTDRNGRVWMRAPIDPGWCGKRIDFNASFAGEREADGSSAVGSVVVRAPTVIVLDVPGTELAGQNFSVKAALKNALSGAPVPQRFIQLEGLSGKTDSSGIAEFPLRFDQKGSGEITASFDGDGYFEPSVSSPRRIDIEPLTCDDGTEVGTCSGQYLCSGARVLVPSCATCGCSGGLVCSSGRCISDEERVSDLIASLQKSNVRIMSDDGIGSGVIIGKAGSDLIVLTNRHVVDPDFASFASKHITIINHDNETAKPLRILVAPNELDLAIVVVGKDIGPPAGMNFSSVARIGSKVLVIGTPLGIPGSVTEGIISNYVETNTSSGFDYEVVQTDAAVNPGNSGGGVFLASSGRLVGITAFKLMIGRNELAEGLGFAVPVRILEDFPPEKWSAITIAE
ncbi:MAG: trypsin-like peptidase domain-containing protein [Candidatus Micrarchaeia archaeon]